jgi:hypothetical protein
MEPKRKWKDMGGGYIIRTVRTKTGNVHTHVLKIGPMGRMTGVKYTEALDMTSPPNPE